MKTKKSAFTLIEVLVCFAIIAILAAMLMPALVAVKKKAEEQRRKARVTEQQSVPSARFNLGDTVYIDGMDITGKVNQVSESGLVDILVKTTNGTLVLQERVNEALLKKVPTRDNNWKY